MQRRDKFILISYKFEYKWFIWLKKRKSRENKSGEEAGCNFNFLAIELIKLDSRHDGGCNYTAKWRHCSVNKEMLALV